MSEANLTVSARGGITVLTINRPDRLNALNRAVVESLDSALSQALDQSSTRAVVITGSGDRAFSAGADLDELADLDISTAYDIISAGQAVFARIERAPVPIIAAVNGLALGGGFELVLACTLPVLANTAKLGLPENGLGLIPGYGGTQRLQRLAGPVVAAHVMLTGARLDAQRAYELGLTPLPPVPPEEVLDTALNLAEQIAGRGPRATTAILQALRRTAPTVEDLAHESALAAIALAGHEGAEGIAAFRQRRSPRFSPELVETS